MVSRKPDTTWCCDKVVTLTPQTRAVDYTWLCLKPLKINTRISKNICVIYVYGHDFLIADILTCKYSYRNV